MAVETILKGKEIPLKSGASFKDKYGYLPHNIRIFLGHYWMEGEPAPLVPNIACLDYSVAKPGGKLLACRWDGEQTLDPGKYLWVERIES